MSHATGRWRAMLFGVTDISGTVTYAWPVHRSRPIAPAHVRLLARVMSARYDRIAAAGGAGPIGSPLEAHAHRLVSVPEREAVARALRRTLAEARRPLTAWTARSYVHRPNVVAAAGVIDAITLRLHSPRPVTVAGMAQLRILLSDGTGPMYGRGGGDLALRLRAALGNL